MFYGNYLMRSGQLRRSRRKGRHGLAEGTKVLCFMTLEAVQAADEDQETPNFAKVARTAMVFQGFHFTPRSSRHITHVSLI